MSRPLTWEQKFAIMKELCGDFSICLRMRQPGDWYVSATDRKVGSQGSRTERSAYGSGKTPEAAVNDDWRQLVDELPRGCFVMVSVGNHVRRVRWTGHWWKDVSELGNTA